MTGEEFRDLRERKYDLTQNETALMLGVTQPTVSLWETGVYSIPSIIGWTWARPRVVKLLRAEPAGAGEPAEEAAG